MDPNNNSSDSPADSPNFFFSFFPESRETQEPGAQPQRSPDVSGRINPQFDMNGPYQDSSNNQPQSAGSAPRPSSFRRPRAHTRSTSFEGRSRRATIERVCPLLTVTSFIEGETSTPGTDSEQTPSFLHLDDVCQDMNDLSFESQPYLCSSNEEMNFGPTDLFRSKSNVCPLETPRVTNLPNPMPDRAIPPRSGSVMKVSKMDVDEPAEVPVNPCKLPRLSRSDLDLTHPLVEKVKSGMRGPFSHSSGCLPTPGERLLSETPKDKFQVITINGMRVPVKRGQHSHHRISIHTAAQFVRGEIPLPPGTELIIWDGRFHYEYEGGHIRNARNFHHNGDLRREEVEKFVVNARSQNKRYVVLCYCQFSSARAPKLLDILRAAERDVQLRNRDSALLLSEESSRFTVFLVDKGYNKFYAHYPELCDPNGYVKEDDMPREGGFCRTIYHATIERACASRILMPSPDGALRRSQSTLESRRFLRPTRIDTRRAPTNYDDENDPDSPCGPAIGKVRPFNIGDL